MGTRLLRRRETRSIPFRRWRDNGTWSIYPVWINFRYHRNNPYDISLDADTHTKRSATFPRQWWCEVLQQADGFETTFANVTVKCTDEDGIRYVQIVFRSAPTVYRTERARIEEFLNSTDAVVPFGAEHYIKQHRRGRIRRRPKREERELAPATQQAEA